MYEVLLKNSLYCLIILQIFVISSVVKIISSLIVLVIDEQAKETIR